MVTCLCHPPDGPQPVSVTVSTRVGVPEAFHGIACTPAGTRRSRLADRSRCTPEGGLLCAAGQWVSVCAMRIRTSPHSRERGVRPDHGRCSLVTRVALILTLTRCTNQQLEPMLFQLSGESHHRRPVRSTHDHPSAGRRLHCALLRCIRLNPAQSGGVKAIRSPTNTVPYEPDNPTSRIVP